MKIIHIVRATTWGGGERYALDLCQKSIEAGYDVAVATRGNAIVDLPFSEVGAEIFHLPLGGPVDFRSPHLLSNKIKEMNDDKVIIHVHTFKDAEIVSHVKRKLAKDFDIKIVCTRHLAKEAHNSKRWKNIYNAIDKLIFVSDYAEKTFRAGFPNITLNKLSVVHNSIIVPEEYRVPAPPPSGDPLTLLYTGRLSPEKGINILIEALSELKDLPIRLRIAGTGKEDYIRKMKSLADCVGVSSRIEWLGFVPDVFKEIREADICVAPSTWGEPFGLTIIEYMSQARPVVTTSNGAQPEIITDGVDGMLVAPDHFDALAQAIRALAENKDLRLKMGAEAANTFLSRFSYDIFFNKIIETYNRLFEE